MPDSTYAVSALGIPSVDGSSVMVADEAFALTDLRRVRALVHAAGSAADLEPDDLDNFVFAVAEIANNAVIHGGGAGWLTIAQSPHELVVKIRDVGPGLPDGLSDLRPEADALSGRGLWLARRLCHHVEVISTLGGVLVRQSAPPPMRTADRTAPPGYAPSSEAGSALLAHHQTPRTQGLRRGSAKPARGGSSA
jgi:anti-sigma regulatory factor (Ser/Thr protein kinase)